MVVFNRNGCVWVVCERSEQNGWSDFGCGMAEKRGSASGKNALSLATAPDPPAAKSSSNELLLTSNQNDHRESDCLPLLWSAGSPCCMGFLYGTITTGQPKLALPLPSLYRRAFLDPIWAVEHDFDL